MKKIKLRHIDVIVPAYNPGAEFYEMFPVLCKQIIEPSWTFSIIVVDDGSSDNKDYFQRVKSFCPNIEVVCHKKNKGRSAARNSGASSALGEILVFLDADCIFNDVNSIEKHRQKLVNDNIDVNFGQIQSKGNDFWSEYFSFVSKKRDQAGKSNHFMALTSANFSIRSEVYWNIGGFNEHYNKYGFEDRDFIACLINNNNKISYSSDIIAAHKDCLSLSKICHKMEQAGRFSAPIFAANHPNYYKNMFYSALDVNNQSVLCWPVTILAKFIPGFIKFGERFISLKNIPFFLKKTLIRTITALSFSWGTLQEKRLK